MANNDPQFEQRKRDHLRIALDSTVQSSLSAGLESVSLIHEALPDLNFEDIDLSSDLNGHKLSVPYFVSSMTAGHEHGHRVNLALAKLSERRQILMGVGSQRRELQDPAAAAEWTNLRKEAPRAILAGNLGIAQLITASTDQVRAMVDRLDAKALFIHLNSLQECLQPEGTPHFRGGLEAISRVVKNVNVPVIIKETGCGFSKETLKRLGNTGIFAVDLAGLGGTHWGRVEGQRAPVGSLQAEASSAFADWGISTLQSLQNAKEAQVSFQIWASGGVRTGVDVAKLSSMGVKLVGLAVPWLQAAVQPDAEAALDRLADRLSFELKTSLFCTGSKNLAELQSGSKWTWRT